jgi:hypothetical protein
MNKRSQNDEDVKALFEKFVNSEQAEQAAEDFLKAEQILRSYPAPGPDDEVTAGIKSQIAWALLDRKEIVFKRKALKAVAVAAAFIVLAALSVKLLEKQSQPQEIVYASIIPRAIWESEDIASDDINLATLTAEIEQIKDEMLALQLGDDGENGSGAVEELEMEFIEINSDFWKG